MSAIPASAALTRGAGSPEAYHNRLRSQIDFNSKLWTCPFCLTRNAFPAHYAQHITQTNLPAELIPNFTSVEYQLPNRTAGAPVFLFTVDVALPQEELDPLRDSLQQSLSLLPENALVGLITYGRYVHVHELGFTDCPKSYAFRGDKEYSASSVAAMLGLDPADSAAGTTAGPGANARAGGPVEVPGTERFLMPVGECQFTLENILEDLGKDPWPREATDRHDRCTGAALSVAVCLLQRTVGWRGARITLFTGGPCTLGPGQVVDKPYKMSLRSHLDIQKGNEEAKHHADATKFYSDLAARCVQNSHVVDVFACALDQVGLLEMKPCVERTGGLCAMADSFGQSVFKESFRRMFARFEDDAPPCDAGHLTVGFAATLEVQTSPEFAVMGALGPCTSLKKASSSVAESSIGEGGTSAWAMGGVDPGTTIALYFDITNNESSPIPPGKRRFLQLVTRYQHSSGRYRLRVTTHGGMWCPDPVANKSALAASFDQEAAAALIARISVHRAREQEPADVLRWVDRNLIRLCTRFADFTKEDASSFSLQPTFSIFPQFMFHLRRSAFLQVFNQSPDEAAYKRMVFAREDVSNSLVMIQPSLICYSFQGPPAPVLLDAQSARQDVILLLDAYFNVVVWHGETIALWRDQGYAERPEHAAFKSLLEAPQHDAGTLMESRFPVPRYIKCDSGKSQARFLMARLNPSVTHKDAEATGSSGVIPTDDVSFQVFMEHLAKLVVAP